MALKATSLNNLYKSSPSSGIVDDSILLYPLLPNNSHEKILELKVMTASLFLKEYHKISMSLFLYNKKILFSITLQSASGVQTPMKLV